MEREECGFLEDRQGLALIGNMLEVELTTSRFIDGRRLFGSFCIYSVRL